MKNFKMKLITRNYFRTKVFEAYVEPFEDDRLILMKRDCTQNIFMYDILSYKEYIQSFDKYVLFDKLSGIYLVQSNTLKKLKALYNDNKEKYENFIKTIQYEKIVKDTTDLFYDFELKRK